MDKKGSLALSITAIVVIVIAFVVLGLGLTLTRTIFKGAQDKIPEALALTALEAEPTSGRPITIQDRVDIDRSKSKTMSIGYYNRMSTRANNARFTMTECLDNSGNAVDASKIPKIASPAENVEASSAVAYSIIMNEQGMSAGTYICTIAVCDGGDCALNTYESKSFFLQVVA